MERGGCLSSLRPSSCGSKATTSQAPCPALRSVTTWRVEAGIRELLGRGRGGSGLGHFPPSFLGPVWAPHHEPGEPAQGSLREPLTPGPPSQPQLPLRHPVLETQQDQDGSIHLPQISPTLWVPSHAVSPGIPWVPCTSATGRKHSLPQAQGQLEGRRGHSEP